MKFTARHAGIDALAKGPGVAALVNRNARRVLAAARADGNPDGAYHRSLGIREAQPTLDGMTAEVFADTPFWHLFEFGSINNPPYRVLSRAVTTAGLKFKEG